MDYSQFLFNKLLCVYSQWFSEQCYDDQYPRTLAEYDDFVKSKFNDENKSEYDCIVEYIQEDLLKDRQYTLGFLQQVVQRQEDIFYLTGLEFGKVNLKDVHPNHAFWISGDHQLEFNLNN